MVSKEELKDALKEMLGELPAFRNFIAGGREEGGGRRDGAGSSRGDDRGGGAGERVGSRRDERGEGDQGGEGTGDGTSGAASGSTIHRSGGKQIGGGRERVSEQGVR